MGNSVNGYKAWRDQARKASERHIELITSEPDYGPIVTAQLFVGANNLSGIVDRITLARIMNARHDGWTSVGAVGVWKGAKEDCVMILVSDYRKKVQGTARAICRELEQDAVGYIELPAMEMM